MEQPQNYISNLTPLRGIAALWVFFFHFQGYIVLFIYPNQTHIAELGYLMVDLFFIMSGFIMLHVYGDKFASYISRKNFWNFIVARFARIYPLHFFTLVVLIVITAASNAWSPVRDPRAIPANILLIHSFGLFHVFTWNIPSWSISAEWWAYMIFPLIAIFLSRNKKLAILVLIPLIVLTYLSIMYWLPRKNPYIPSSIVVHDLDATYDYGYLRGLAGFALGMLSYKLYQSRLMEKFFQKDIVALLVVGGTLYAMHVKINDGFYMALFTLVVLCFACNVGKLKNLCNNRFAQYIGDISYSIYLIHPFILLPFLAGAHLPFVKYGKLAYEHEAGFWVGLMYFIILLVVVIGLSSLSYKFVEVPARKWINERWKKQKTVLASTA